MTDNAWEYSSTPASNTSVGAVNTAEGMAPGLVNDSLRGLAAQLTTALFKQGSDITAAATTNIAATGTSDYVKITGATPITAFGTPTNNPKRWIQWGGGNVVTYNATSMILRGGVSKTYAAGDISAVVHEGSGNWRELVHDKADGSPIVPGTAGKHKLWIPAAAMTAVPNAPASFATERSSFTVPYNVWDFDQTADEGVFFNIGMPSSWDEGTVTFVPIWTAASGAGTVVFGLFGQALSNDDALGTNFSATVTSTDTLITAADVHRGPESSALTIDGTPAANDFVTFMVFRVPGSDTLNADARLLGIELYLTTDAAVDVA